MIRVVAAVLAALASVASPQAAPAVGWKPPAVGFSVAGDRLVVTTPGYRLTVSRASGAILAQKTTHYGAFTRPTRLIIYYGQAAAYNTPYIGMETREFADVAALAAHAVRGQTALEKIYLLNALEPGLEAFEIFPACVWCT